MKKTAIIALSLLVALAVVGVGYALWYEVIFIDGTVNTGDLDATVVVDGTYDTEPETKDFSYMELMPYGEQGVYATIYNAYPCIDYYGYFAIQNTGTIPFHTDWHNVFFNELPVGATLEILFLDTWDMDGDGVYYEPVEGWQFHPGDYAWCLIHVHLDNDAEQGATYSFASDLWVTQYNEGNYAGVRPRVMP